MEIFKYLFQKNLAIQLIYCEINFTLTWSQNCIIFGVPGGTTFKKLYAKRFVSVITSSIQRAIQNYYNK